MYNSIPRLWSKKAQKYVRRALRRVAVTTSMVYVYNTVTDVVDRSWIHLKITLSHDFHMWVLDDLSINNTTHN